MKTIKVMIVDGSAVLRQVLSSVFEKEDGMEVIGVAADPVFAIEKMGKTWPDVLIVDIEMPRMDGITFLKKIMAEHPTPVIVFSTLTEKGSVATMQALAAGAVSVVTKPKLGLKLYLQESSEHLVRTVRTAAHAHLKRSGSSPSVTVPPKLTADAVLPAAEHVMEETTQTVIAIGTSTGGTLALETVLTALPRTSPGILIVQHMPEQFTEAFARRLDDICRISVTEARHGDQVMPGRALIAQGGRHMMLRRSGAQYYVDVVEGPPVSRHRPSVDVLFRSMAKFAGKNALGIIMTGMGDDGAKGLLEMHQMGALTIAQDEESCVVYGMPKEAIKLGAVDKIVALQQIAAEISACVNQTKL
ncbi:chemotaxis response regulator protein-glutamate methylesterase [Candidatus Methylospira mobilis]|uniref:Protein-glutamate methylesterase/protein-glutamine glutaminase n=1 Tax=Candidatus Methylospira mobilis TaxID=1808979 RepID=A0A5Q0BG67_9GAMM|nr:chemotaxis response regulator protein-glutamate methylesterase [Candidatus Methylospira mobilis]QFY42122.1 chemotaxis response regulator protein-glutamate methylesterase [Candidatus Methylospira mobilis]WNV03134.1 chemotaxis response regulator protein-glutamate methylesterase [Candidatus Methylospira mobilis]